MKKIKPFPVEIFALQNVYEKLEQEIREYEESEMYDRGILKAMEIVAEEIDNAIDRQK